MDKLAIDNPDSPKINDIKIAIDNPELPHNGKIIDKIIVSQYIDVDRYVVTYSELDNSFLGWSLNVEMDGQQEPGAYLKPHESYGIKGYRKFMLYKNILLCYGNDDLKKAIVIELNGNNSRFFQLERPSKGVFSDVQVTFLSNGDLIIINTHRKIHLYPFENISTSDASIWKYSQIYDIKTDKSLNYPPNPCPNYFFCQTKLFLFNNGLVTQWDFPTMTIEKQYHSFHLFSGNGNLYRYNIVMNEDKTLLAICTGRDDKHIDIYSMKTGIQVSRYVSKNYEPLEFVTLKDGSIEGLIIHYEYKEYKFIYPFDPSNAIGLNIEERSIVTKSNRKIYINENNNICITADITFKKTTCTFETIRNMLNDIVSKDEVDCDFSEDMIKIEDSERFHIIIKRVDDYKFEVKGKSIDVFGQEETINTNTLSSNKILSYKRLDNPNNQDLVLITTSGIYIYTKIVEDFLELRYFWNNQDWNNYDYSEGYEKIKNIFQKILKNEFNDSLPSLPSPSFDRLAESIINDKDSVTSQQIDKIDKINLAEFSKLGSKFSELVAELSKLIKSGPSENDPRIANKGKEIQMIFDIIIKLIEKKDIYDRYNRYMPLLSFISLKLLDLYDNHLPDLVMKYILHTSILLDPLCSSVKNLKNTSLHAYSKVVYVKKSNKYFTLENENLMNFLFFLFFPLTFPSFYFYYYYVENVQIPTISFVVPFFQICKYQEKDYDFWKEILYKPGTNSWNEILFIRPKYILFSNIDSKNFYRWWNFAAIIDFKWKTFGKYYYYSIWIFYTIFYLCFTLASTLDLSDYYRKIFFITSISLGLTHLFFEFRQLLWKPIIYFQDPWNLFDVGAYFLPIITSIYWLINGNLAFQIAAISILLLTFKFLLFFRVFQSHGKYFVIIIGVAKEVFPFLVVLFFIILGFGLAFYILLKATKPFSLDDPAFNNDDKNNPWNLAIKYNSVYSDGTINPNPTLIQTPDSNTNMFTWFPTSLLAMYLFLTGDSESFSSWTYRDDPLITVLLFVFTFFTAIYLMNLFIGLLNLAIVDYNKHEEYLLIKAQIIMEIELFYMFPHQRRKKEWFPDWIYYDVPVEEVQRLINAIDNKQTGFDSPPFIPFISEKLRESAGIPKPIDNIQDMQGELEQTKEELKQTRNKLEYLTEQMVKLINLHNK